MLSEEEETLLRKNIGKCCLWLGLERIATKSEAPIAIALRHPGKDQRAPFERLAHHLREAAKAWESVRDTEGHGERYEVHIVNGKTKSVPALHPCDHLTALADYAEHKLEQLRTINENYSNPPPWPIFVRRVAKCLSDAGLKPGATGRLYKEGKPTWFQKFMLDLNASLDPAVAETVHSPDAFCAAVAKAMGNNS